MLPQLGLNFRLEMSSPGCFLSRLPGPPNAPFTGPAAARQTVAVRILLPPSEAKRPGGDGPPVHFGRDRLGAARRRAATALSRFAAQAGAAEALALPARSAADELLADRRVRASATMPALLRYAGIVYDGLDAPSLGRAERAAADASVLIFSGLWGVVRADELVPNYRLPAAAALPELGIMATYWRPLLDRAVPPMLGDGLVIDLRSSDYAAMWRPRPELRERVVVVRVLSRRPSGPPAVISYPSKLGKGKLTRALLGRGAATVEDVLDAWRAAGGWDGQRTARGLDLID
jgi:cytoplasmic iron level regulating protein YaaA (DUF328/UPF0246 family)